MRAHLQYGNRFAGEENFRKVQQACVSYLGYLTAVTGASFKQSYGGDDLDQPSFVVEFHPFLIDIIEFYRVLIYTVFLGQHSKNRNFPMLYLTDRTTVYYVAMRGSH